MQKPFLAVAALLLSTLIYSFFGVLTRLVGFDLPIYYASLTRDVLGAVILLLPFYLLKKFKKVNKSDLPWLILRSLGGTLSFLGSFYSFYYLPIGTAYFIFYGGSTISGFLLGSILFKEKIDYLEGFSLFLALLGLYSIYSLGDLSASLLYVCWALLGGFGVAIWNTFSKKVSNHYDATQLNGLDFFFSGLIMLVLSMTAKEKWLLPTFTLPWFVSLLFVLMFIVTGQLMIYGFKYLDAQKASLIMLTEVVFGAIIGAIFFKEALTSHTIYGGLTILIATALPSLKMILFKNKKIRFLTLIFALIVIS